MMTAGLLVALVLVQTDGAETPDRLNVLRIESEGGLLGLAGSGTLAFERALGPGASVDVGLFSSFPGGLGQFGKSFSYRSTESRGFAGGVRLGLKWYAASTAPSGLWLGAWAKAAMSQYQSEFAPVDPAAPVISDRTEGMSFGGALLVGYAHVFPFGLSLQLSGGLSAFHSASRTTTTELDFAGEPIPERTYSSLDVAPTVSFGLGWAF